MTGTLVLVGTPIGNRGDLSPRARETILGADLLLCEDTRSVSRLFEPGATLPPRISCFVGNEAERAGLLRARLAEGARVVFVSEAGMPTWSDPGATLVRAALEGGFSVDVIPGPTAASMAVSLSGFTGSDVHFMGFLPRRGSARASALTQIARASATVVLYEAGNRVPALLQELAAIAGDRAMVIARELTKLHQEALRGTAQALAERVEEAVRGEVTVVIAGRSDAVDDDPGREAARAVWRALCDETLRPRARARAIAERTGLDTREIYEALGRLASKADESAD